MFASQLNAKLKQYVSFYPDHEAFAVDAFSMNWDKKFQESLKKYKWIRPK